MGINVGQRKDIEDDKIKIEGGTDGTEIGNTGDNLHVNGALRGAGTQAALTIGTTAAEAKVGGSALANRGHLSIQPNANSVYYGYTNGVTTSNGTRIFKDQTVWFDVSDGTSVWLIADGAGKDVRITEVAIA